MVLIDTLVLALCGAEEMVVEHSAIDQVQGAILLLLNPWIVWRD
jgi:hypothetical protein